MASARLYRVQGRVQGIGFRWFVERAAGDLGLGGWVRNLPDGDVEVYAVGGDEQLDQLRALLQEGPRGARVLRVDESPAPVRSSSRHFRIEY